MFEPAAIVPVIGATNVAIATEAPRAPRPATLTPIASALRSAAESASTRTSPVTVNVFGSSVAETVTFG